MHNLWKDQDRKVHFKMYKSGKHWVFAGLAVVGLGMGLGISGGNVLADTHVDGSVPQTDHEDTAQMIITDKQPGEPDGTNPKGQVNLPASDDESHSQSAKVEINPSLSTDNTDEKSAADVAVVNTPKVADHTTTAQNTINKDKKTDNNTHVSKTKPNESDNQSASAPIEKLSDTNPQTKPNSDTKQSLKAKTASNHSVEADAAISSSESKTAADHETNSNESNTVIVKPENFKDYFQVNSHATWNGNMLTLTTGHHQSGNATLKTKIDMQNSFQLKGSVMLGDGNYPSTEWADGISFGFHSGDVNAHGGAGADMGMGGLPDGFGFKLDTYSNTDPDHEDPERFIYIPYFGGLQETQAFGAFAYNNNKPGNPSETYNPSKLSDPDAPKALAAGADDSLKPKHFYPVEIDYDGKTHDMTAIFDNDVAHRKITWHHNVSHWSENKKALSFFIAASTGQRGGLQQFKFDSFQYTVPSVVNVKFTDEDGRTIPNAPQPLTIYGKPGQKVDLTGVTADIQKIERNGQYYFDRVKKEGIGDFDVNKNLLTMSKQTQDINYYFAKSQAKINANDFTIYAGQPWTSDLKNVTAVAKNGQAIDPSDLVVIPEGDSQTPGTYNVTYRLNQQCYHNGPVQSVTKTVKATVIENKSKIEVKDASYSVGDKFDPAKSLVSAVDGQGKSVSLDSGELTSQVSDADGHSVAQDAVTAHSGDYYLQFSYKNGQQVLSKSKRSKITVIQPNNITVDLIAPNNDQVRSILPKDHQTGDQIDVAPSSKYLASIIPTGYHYAKADELQTDETQPTVNPVYSGKEQTVKVYVVGDTVDKNAANALTVHHYLKDSADVKVAPDSSIGGRIGQKVVATLKDAAHAAEGYTLVPNQKDQTATLKLNQGSQVKFYYTADPQDNIKVNVLNAANVDIVKVTKPEGHHTGDVLDVSPNSSFLDVAKERGYHYATGDELNGHIQPLGNPTYSAKPQEVNIYVVGNTITDKMDNSLLIHYFKDNTTTAIKPERRFGGIVGSTVTLKLNDKEQQVPGYELVSPDKDVEWTLNNSNGQVQNFCYKPSEQKNIAVHFMNVQTDKPVGSPVDPLGHTNETLNLSETSNQIHVPEGYHWATKEELDKYQRQQTQEMKWGTQKQNANVYVTGNPIDANSKNALTVNYYLQDDHSLKTKTAIRNADKIGGNVGDQVTVDPQSKDNHIDGYTAVGKEKITRTLGTSPTDPVNLYYTANSLNNITVKVVDVNGNPDTFVTTETPAGKTGQKLDLAHNVNIPDGYHLATNDELKQHNATQPNNPTYKADSQQTTVYVAGDDVTDAVTVHYYLQDEQGKPTMTEVAKDTSINSKVGQTVTVDPEHQSPKIDGFTIVPNQKKQLITTKYKIHSVVPVYYTGNVSSNINVHFINSNTGETVQTEHPQGHTGGVLNLNDDSRVPIPNGYHRTDPNAAGNKQSQNPTYTTKEKDVQVYITGNPISSHDKNALVINHYLVDDMGQKTTDSFHTLPKIVGGQVGQSITIDPQAPENQIPGYTAIDQAKITRKLAAHPVDPVNLYYKADTLHNITIEEYDAFGNPGKYVTTAVPTGKTGQKLDLADNQNLHIPNGYHLATSDELKANKVSQPADPTYSPTSQTVRVYIAGNIVKNAMTVHHYLRDEQGKLTTKMIADDTHLRGRVGQTLTFKPSSEPQKFPGYTIVSGQPEKSEPVNPETPGETAIYYTGNLNQTISVHFIDKQTKKTVTVEVPEGHTGSVLDLTNPDKVKIPDGYHRVEQITQNPTYSTDKQDVNVYVAGNEAKDSVTVHYYLQDEQGRPTTIKIADDSQIGTQVGQTVTFDPNKNPKKIDGYTLVSKQTQKVVEIQPNMHQEIPVYYTGDKNNKITVHFVDPKNNGTTFPTEKPEGHTGSVLNLDDNNQIKIPAGYHRLNPADIPNSKNRPANPTYSTKDQNVDVYITGDPVDSNDVNALIINHYLQDGKGQQTKHVVGPSKRVGGQVGEVITIDPQNSDNQIAGYTAVGKSPISRTLGVKAGSPIDLYYTANAANNITVHEFTVNGNHVALINTATPNGKTGETLKLDDNSNLTIPVGYHIATPDELKDAKVSQPTDLTYKASPQTVSVYVAGNQVDKAVMVHSYLQDETGKKTKTKVAHDQFLHGRVGQDVPVDPAKYPQKIDGYTIVPNQPVNSLTIPATGKEEAAIYYTGDKNTNVVVHFIDSNTGKSVTVETPQGHTGSSLDLNDNAKVKVPEGYHRVDKGNQSQNKNLKFTNTKQDVNVYVAGNVIKDAVTTQYYLQDENGKPTDSPIAPEKPHSGTVGQDITIHPAVIDGYTISPNQGKMVFDVTPGMHKVVPIYYTGNKNNMISVHFIDPNDQNHTVQIEKPAGHTGSVLNLNDNTIIHIPDGYHRVDTADIPGKKQSENPRFSMKEQNVDVYVTGNPIDQNSKNALIVNHYLEDESGKPTTKSIGKPLRIGGRVGAKIIVDPQDKQNEIPGYTVVKAQPITKYLTNHPIDPVSLYYTANEVHNITINEYDVNGDSDKPIQISVPTGKTGTQLDLNDVNNLKIPEGYHKATATELKGHQQPTDPTYTASPQDVKVYVVGNRVKNAVTVHYYLMDETGKATTIPVSKDQTSDGQVGQKITVDPSDQPQQIDGYTLLPNQPKHQWLVTPTTQEKTTIYYTGDVNSHVVVHYVDANTGKTISVDRPQGHTGGALNLDDNSKIVIPDGYHISDQQELLNGEKQPTNPTYTAKDQNVDVFITGDVIEPNDGNAVTVHHYLSGTSNPIIPDTKVGGRVGQVVQIDPQADNNQITGYTSDADQFVQRRTLGTAPVADATIYYTPNDEQNITIKYVDGNTGKVVGTATPKGHFGGQIDIDNPSVAKIPDGYHRAATNELPKGKQQPKGNLTFTDKDQDVVVYVFGNYSGNNGGYGGSDVVTPTPTTKPEQSKASQPANPVVKVPVSNDSVPRNRRSTIKKGEVVYSLKKIYLYKNKTFSKKQRIAGYVKKPRVYRPMFVVIGHSYSKNGLMRYKVRDVNHLTKNRHLVGYITANAEYVRPVYYQGTHRTITVINPLGVNSYKHKDLSGKTRKYKQGTVLHVAKVVHHHLTTRYVLTNGRYVTANRKLVITGNKKMPRTIRVKKTINRYKNVNFTHRNKKHIQRGTKLRVLGYDYSHANSVSRHGTLRYRVTGGYVTGNSKFVKIYR